MLAGTEWAGIPSTAEGLEVVSVDLVGLDIARIHHLSDETYRVYCDVAFVAEMEGEVTSDPEDVFHPRQIISTDMSHRYWTAVNFRAVGTVLVQVDYDASSNEIVGSFFLPLSHWTSYDTAVEQLEQAQHEVMGSVWPSHSAGEG
jgi:hypothetical protein